MKYLQLLQISIQHDDFLFLIVVAVGTSSQSSRILQYFRPLVVTNGKIAVFSSFDKQWCFQLSNQFFALQKKGIVATVQSGANLFQHIKRSNALNIPCAHEKFIPLQSLNAFNGFSALSTTDGKDFMLKIKWQLGVCSKIVNNSKICNR